MNSTSSLRSAGSLNLPTLAALLAEKVRRDRESCKTLAGFVRAAWHILEPNTPYVHNWHIDAICQHLEAVTSGRINRLLINVPPGSSKSLIVSVLWPAWEWGPCGRRSLRYITTAFNDGPVKRDTRKSRDLILSEWYRARWPQVVLTRTGETSFANSSTGTREGVAFGSLTSQRGDRLIIDDPHSTETAESAAERLATTRRFREGALNRLNDQERSAIVVIMQRLHEEDVSGVILSLKMGYVHLCLPMEFEVERACSTSIGFSDPRVADGELLDPVRFPRDTVDGLQKDMGSYAWAGQYQQRPAPREGGSFKKHWFEIVNAVPAGGRMVRAWDLAASKDSGDWTVGLLMKVYAGVYYIVDVNRFRGSPHDVDRAIETTADQDAATYGDANVRFRLPQDPGQAGKSQKTSHAKLLTGHTFRILPVTGEKSVRAQPLASQAEAGNVKLLKAPWNAAFLDEIGSFPNASHDDQVDAASDAFAELVATANLGGINVTPLVITGSRPGPGA